jgi:hypothetical protein
VLKIIHVFTSAAVNYLPKVRLLLASLKKYHPEFIVHLALPDKKPDWLSANKEGIESIITIDDLEIPEKKAWIFKHNIVELSTAIKPFILHRLLNQKDCTAVLYFDPDIVLFSRLDDLLEKLYTGSIALTPHLAQPVQSDNLESIKEHEIYSSLKNGVFNLGFIGVKKDDNGLRFSKWWAERLYHFCYDEPGIGLFTDQKWIDFVPIFFDGVIILKNPRFNVATWNINNREMKGSIENEITVNGTPLGFYHFTGWDSGDHLSQVMRHGQKNMALLNLLGWYKKMLRRDLIAESTKWAFGSFTNGQPIIQKHRLIYRMRNDLQKDFPDPFNVSQSNCYLKWYTSRAYIEHRSLFF